LTFLGRFDDSVKELKSIIDKDPKSFHAHAYLSIALAEKGDKEGAKIYGEKAVALAPNEEAATRLREFLASILEKAGGKDQDKGEAKGAAIDDFYASLKANPVAGSHFVRGEIKDKTLILYFKDFPMKQMPPFAREKFLATIKSSLGASPITVIKFLDSDSGEELDNAKIN
jgi:tetratricopeptide (TPR) repeat protein